MKLQDAVSKLAECRLKTVLANREILLEAWVAETGIHPKNAVLCTQETWNEDGTTMTVRSWVERRTGAEPIPEGCER